MIRIRHGALASDADAHDAGRIIAGDQRNRVRLRSPFKRHCACRIRPALWDIDTLKPIPRHAKRNNRQERGKLRKEKLASPGAHSIHRLPDGDVLPAGQGVSRRLSGVFSPRQHTDEHLHVGCDVACLSRLGKWRRPYPADLRRLVSRHAHVDSPASDDRLRGAHPPPGDRKLRRKAAKPRVSATAIPFKDLSLRRQIAYIAAGLAGYVLAIPGSILVIALRRLQPDRAG